ncbi:MAG: right-handed parallel beta-helix repeat-containing protein [Oscillospiraceae bacterium]|nr:right-handed parallel beta-helix repeat-containing protein [Oscillospiraceae bacterium]
MSFNILDYGASANGVLCTDSIQRAIDDCFLSGGGEVVIPEGVYLTGGLRLRSNVTLHLLERAVLMGSINPEDYTGYINDTIEPIPLKEREEPVSTVKPGEKVGRSVYPYSRWNNAIIRAIHAKNIAIIGEPGSQINGQNCYDSLGEENYRGPHAINMWFCENVTLSGYTITDSANWAHAIQNSANITLRNVTVLAGHDGFDVRTCDNILVENCTFKTGDDCIAGFDNINVVVRGCYFESACSMLRFGGTDVLVENCWGIAPATYGFRNWLSDEEKQNRAPTTHKCRHSCHNVLLYYCDNRAAVRKTPGNIVIRNSYFRNPNTVMRLPFGHMWCCNRSLADVTFEGCVIDGICAPVPLNAPEEEPLTFTMKDCIVTAREGSEDIEFITGTNIKKIELENVTLKNFLDPKIICQPEAEITVKD